MLLLYNLEIPISVVHVGSIWVLGVGIHVRFWGHILEWICQCFLYDNISN